MNHCNDCRTEKVPLFVGSCHSRPSTLYKFLHLRKPDAEWAAHTANKFPSAWNWRQNTSRSHVPVTICGFTSTAKRFVGATCAIAGDLPSQSVLSQGVPLKFKLALPGLTGLQPARGAARSLIPQLRRRQAKPWGSLGGRCEQAEELAVWVGSFLCTHQLGRRQTRALGNPSSLCSSGDCKGLLVRLSSFWWPTRDGMGQVGKLGSRSEVELQHLSPRKPREGRPGTARDVWVRANSKREKANGWCLYLQIRGVLGLAAARGLW